MADPSRGECTVGVSDHSRVALGLGLVPFFFSAVEGVVRRVVRGGFVRGGASFDT